MGAAGACCADARSNDLDQNNFGLLKIKWTNQKIFGIDNYLELEEQDCAPQFKNKYEERA